LGIVVAPFLNFIFHCCHPSSSTKEVNVKVNQPLEFSCLFLCVCISVFDCMRLCACDKQLRYTFAKYMLLQEPLLVVTALFCLFLLVIVYVRLDFAISKVRVSIASVLIILN